MVSLLAKLGKKGIPVCCRIACNSRIILVLRDYTYFVQDPAAYFVLFIACWGAINILFLVDLLHGLCEFWYTQVDSWGLMIDNMVMFFAGTMIPCHYCPRTLKRFQTGCLLNTRALFDRRFHGTAYLDSDRYRHAGSVVLDAGFSHDGVDGLASWLKTL